MEPDTQGNRVFVLGAGFSKASGMPDAKDLTRLILNAGFLLDNEGFRAWINDIEVRVARLEDDHGLNI
ncbi:MAG: hypothetical protein IIB60_05130 [Planctomycetes bacterium]|nr:hypothetical protein [Planctomycetota bacterium]